MNRHASVNRIFRLIWSGAMQAFIPVAETARGRVKGMGRSRTMQATALIMAVGWAPGAIGQTLPQGGVVRAGSATVTSTATRMDVTTATTRTAIDWTSFSIGAGNQVVSVLAVGVREIASEGGVA